ncbi:non-homologous end-joining DNA ligase [Nocardia sp. NPDC050712]|uniref:non-homologous end-joining DNA ligase n=1 Tax=Nocardia sp. NPDC050712 TaxID=3155518 RepID=UPI0033E1B170
MLATAGRPPDEPDRWAIEMKWDGIRALVECDGTRCRLFSRNGRDISGSFPELTAQLLTLADGRSLLIDGEITAPEPASGAPSFARLQRRMHVLEPSAALRRDVPVEYFAFDLLELEGESLMSLPYQERRDRLADLEFEAPGIRASPYWVDVDAETMLALAHEHHLEGIVSKLLTSPYRPGTRSPAWIKTPFRRTTEAVVAGWLPGSGRLTTMFGSLVLGAYDAAGHLVHIGNVGTGWTMPARRALQAELDRIARTDSPFDLPAPAALTRTAHWVEPVIVADVEYREASTEGLRHPSWRGVRVDKSPREVTVPKANG